MKSGNKRVLLQLIVCNLSVLYSGRVTHFVVYFCSHDNFFNNMVSLNLQLLTRFFFSAWCNICRWLAVDKYAQIQHPQKNCRKRLTANLKSLFSRVSFICGKILKYTYFFESYSLKSFYCTKNCLMQSLVSKFWFLKVA